MTKTEAGRHELPPRLDRAEQLRQFDGQRSRSRTYLSVPSLKKMPRPGRPPEYVDLGRGRHSDRGQCRGLRPGGRRHAGTHQARHGSTTSDQIVRLNDRRVSVEGRIVLRPEMASTHRSAVPRPSPVLQDPTGLRLDE